MRTELEVRNTETPTFAARSADMSSADTNDPLETERAFATNGKTEQSDREDA
jgi:hypothetical protein